MNSDLGYLRKYSLNPETQLFLDLKYKNHYMDNKKIITRKQTNIDYDILFYNLILFISNDKEVLKKYSIDFKELCIFNRHIEKKIKLNLIKFIDNYPFKNIRPKLKAIATNNLAYNDNICLTTLKVLCGLFNKYIIFINESIYHKMLDYDDNDDGNDDSKLYYLLNYKTMTITKLYSNNMSRVLESLYEIKDIIKPIYSLSHYKLDELKNILTLLKVPYNKTHKKKELYEMMKLYMNHLTIKNDIN